MASLEEKLLYEIEWRTDELSIIKTLPFLVNLSQQQKEIMRKYSIPTIYSLWEGFVVECFSIYARELSSLALVRHQIHLNLLAHCLDMELGLNSPIMDFEKKKSTAKNLMVFMDSQIKISTKLPTDSNVNWNVINKILNRFNLKLLPENPFSKQLNKLLLIRNNIAHGQHTIPVDQIMIDELSISVIGLMHEIFERISEGFKFKTYLEIVTL